MKKILKKVLPESIWNFLRKVKARLKFVNCAKSNPPPYNVLLERDALPRSNYGYCIYHAAHLAQRLNRKGISIIEFGVGGGNGLIAIDR
jgi:hypothetical protein